MRTNQDIQLGLRILLRHAPNLYHLGVTAGTNSHLLPRRRRNWHAERNQRLAREYGLYPPARGR